MSSEESIKKEVERFTKISESDWVLLHNRARNIESQFPLEDKEDQQNALYWIELTMQQLQEIRKKVIETQPEEKKSGQKTKVF